MMNLSEQNKRGKTFYFAPEEKKKEFFSLVINHSCDVDRGLFFYMNEKKKRKRVNPGAKFVIFFAVHFCAFLFAFVIKVCLFSLCFANLFSDRLDRRDIPAVMET